MIKRFRPYYFDPHRLTGHEATMRQNSEGDYVLHTDYSRAREALQTAETVMMIVEPRSHKAEYLQALALIREVLGSSVETACQHDRFKPNPTLQWLGSSLDPKADTHLHRCTVCDSRFDLPIGHAQSDRGVAK